jgi:PAS domain S-box-containing protein
MQQGGGETTAPPIVSLLAGKARLIDVLPHLHQHAIDVTGGRCTLLFEHNPRTGVMQATSGYGLDVLRTDPWIPDPEEAMLADGAFRRRAPTLVADADRQTPDLAARLGSRSVLVVPLVQGDERIGMLAVGFPGPPAAAAAGGNGSNIGDVFVTALQLFRYRQRDELQRDLRELIDEFSGSLSATLNLAAGLDIFCHGANRLFGADRTSVWIHDRRTRHLALQASSDPEHFSRGVSVSTDDATAAAAVAMRRVRAEIVSASGEAVTSMVTVPLRGCRRALGTIVFEGVRVETGGELDLLDRADELGRQLSGAVETMQLLEDVVQSRGELENTFDSIAHLVAVSDRHGRLVHVNQAFASRLGRSRDELLNRPVSECLGPELVAWLAANELAGGRAKGQPPTTREIVDPVLKGPFMVTLTDFLGHDRERAGSVIVARDLKPQTRLEAEQQELRKRLTQSEKLAALGQFVAGIAHELNNPLQGVLGHLELLRATDSFPRQLRPEVQAIYREADRAAKIVRNLLVFAGTRRLARRPVNLTAVLQRVLRLRAAACRACGIEVVRHYDEKLPRVQSDPLLLHQAFLNIVMNAEQAIAATERPGRIEIAVFAAKSGDRVVATVRDTGGGIPTEVLPRIFEPFYTTKDVGQGTGLGLAIAFGIVQEHDGHIVAANHPDGGAVFTVELPATPASARAADKVADA